MHPRCVGPPCGSFRGNATCSLDERLVGILVHLNGSAACLPEQAVQLAGARRVRSTYTRQVALAAGQREAAMLIAASSGWCVRNYGNGITVGSWHKNLQSELSLA